MSQFNPDDPTLPAPRPPGPSIQKRIGRFEVTQVLGEGAFGRVYLAFDPQLGRQVAIKVPKPEALTPEFRERFLREARANATVHHRNVCPLFDVGTEGGVPYLVMHYVVGTTLAALLERMNAPLPPRHALAIARKLALGVAAAHEKGVTHRDLKPANVLYETATREVLITDFGLGLRADDPRLTTDGAVCGTPAYMSPEQARGKQNEIGPLSDVYSLGVILYRMLTGKVPFTGAVLEVLMQHAEAQPKFPSAVYPGLDPRLDAICLKAMAKRPIDRYPSAKAFADALTDYLKSDERSESNAELPFASMMAEETAVSAHQPPARLATAAPAPRAMRAPPAKRRKGPLIAALLGVVLLAGAGAAWVFRADIERLMKPKPEVAGPPSAGAGATEPEPIQIAPMPHLKVDQKKLIGKWERTTLKKTEIWDFTHDGELVRSTSGATTAPKASKYEIQGNKVIVDVVRIKDTSPTAYTVLELTDTAMTFKLPGGAEYEFKRVPLPAKK